MGPWRLQMFTFDRFGIRFGIRNFDEALTTTLPKECNNNTEVCEAIRPIVNPSVNTADNRLNGYTFDNAGNTTRDAESRRFTYDGENKQVKVETLDLNGNPVSTVGEYSYDGDGRRIKKHVPSSGEVTVFVYDAAGKLIGEYSTITETQSPKVSYTTHDHLGSPRILTDQNGSVISRRDFHPFGEETFTPQRVQGLGYQPDDVRQKFTSYQRDNEIDLDFAQARYYNKNHGRFGSIDPLYESANAKVPQSWNRYNYALNNPLLFIDPTGLSACDPAKDPTCKSDKPPIPRECIGCTWAPGPDGRPIIVDPNGNPWLPTIREEVTVPIQSDGGGTAGKESQTGLPWWKRVLIELGIMGAATAAGTTGGGGDSFGRCRRRGSCGYRGIRTRNNHCRLCNSGWEYW